MPDARRVDMGEDTNESFRPMFASDARELVVYGGAGAGKSYAVAQKILSKALKHKDSEERRRILIVRKYGPSLKLTCWKLMGDLLKKYRIPYQDNKSDLTIRIGNSELLFMPVVNTTEEAADRLKSLTDITDIWIEEATELSFEEYQQIKLRLRGEELKNGYRQVVLTFNPIDKNHWIYDYFFMGNRGERQKYTYRDNRFIDEDYKAELEGLAEIDQVLYDVYTLGNWGVFGELIYTRYQVEEFDHAKLDLEEVVAGVDFGYEHPAAWVLIGLSGNRAWVVDEVYERKKITSELITLIQDKQEDYGARPPTYCDSAEPDRIEEMTRAGLRVYPADKNVSDGIMAVKEYRLVIHPRCINLIKEIRGYQRKKDRWGNVLEEPIKAHDDVCDALRYAIYSHRRTAAAPVSQVYIYEDPVAISPF